MKWDENKLDSVFESMTVSMKEMLSRKNEEAVAMGEVLGYWWYQLKDCKKES